MTPTVKAGYGNRSGDGIINGHSRHANIKPRLHRLLKGTVCINHDIVKYPNPAQEAPDGEPICCAQLQLQRLTSVQQEHPPEACTAQPATEDVSEAMI